MSENLDLTTNLQPTGYVSTSIGELALFTITIGDQINVQENLPQGLLDSTSADYIRALTHAVCHKKDDLGSTQIRPSGPTLTKVELNTLNVKDLEAVAEEVLKQNDYLFKAQQGSGKLGRIVHPRNEDESASDYLLRLIKIEEEEIKDHINNSNFANAINSFSDASKSGIYLTVSQGQKLGRAIRELQRNDIASKISVPKNDSSGIDSLKDLEKKPQKELRQISQQIDSLLGINADVVEYIKQVNRSQSQLSAEINQSSINSANSSRKALIASKLIIAVGSLSLLISVIFRFCELNKTPTHVESIIGAIDKVDESINGESIRKEAFEDYKDSVTTVISQLKSELRVLQLKSEFRLIPQNSPRPYYFLKDDSSQDN